MRTERKASAAGATEAVAVAVDVARDLDSMVVPNAASPASNTARRDRTARAISRIGRPVIAVAERSTPLALATTMMASDLGTFGESVVVVSVVLLVVLDGGVVVETGFGTVVPSTTRASSSELRV